MKIGNLTINESVDVESDDEKGTMDNSSDGESGEGGPKHLGPWKKPELLPQPEVTEVVAAAPPPPPVTSGSSYKPPHLRNVQPVAASPRQRAKNIAPDIHSEEYFPTLNSKQQQSNEPTGPWGRRYGLTILIDKRELCAPKIYLFNDKFILGNEKKVCSRKCVTEGEADRTACKTRKLKRPSSLWVTSTVPFRKIKAEIFLDLIKTINSHHITSSPFSVSWPSCAIKYVF